MMIVTVKKEVEFFGGRSGSLISIKNGVATIEGQYSPFSVNTEDIEEDISGWAYIPKFEADMETPPKSPPTKVDKAAHGIISTWDFGDGSKIVTREDSFETRSRIEYDDNDNKSGGVSVVSIHEMSVYDTGGKLFKRQTLS